MLILTLLSACTVGTIDSGPLGQPGGGGGGSAGGGGGGGGGGMGAPDAGGGGGGGGNVTPDAAVDAAAFACRNKVSTAQLGDGHHNPGQDCMNGCHNHGFTLAGTLMTTATGATAFQGGTITVTDAAGKTFDMVSQLNGNFYTSTAVTFPVTVIASSCPTVQMMAATVPSGSGGCNKTGCHQPNATGYVHLP